MLACRLVWEPTICAHFTVVLSVFVKFCLFLEALSGAGSEAVTGGNAVFYQTPSGLVFAAPSTSAATLSPEGYILSVPGTPAFALPPKVVSGHSEFCVYCLLKNTYDSVK